jgi:phosphoribosylglycinamide formyltransferase 1
MSTQGRIVALISGSGSNMEALASACERGEIQASVVAVLADRDCTGLELAAARSIPTGKVVPGDFDSREAWSEALRDAVMRYEPDLVVSAGFMRILSPVFVDAFAGRLINLHPALLPAFPGAHAVRDALAAGVRVTGSTVHFVDHLVDHGPIIMQVPVAVEPGDTEGSLHERIKEAEHGMRVDACKLFVEGKVHLDAGRVLIER